MCVLYLDFSFLVTICICFVLLYSVQCAIMHGYDVGYVFFYCMLMGVDIHRMNAMSIYLLLLFT